MQRNIKNSEKLGSSQFIQQLVLKHDFQKYQAIFIQEPP